MLKHIKSSVSDKITGNKFRQGILWNYVSFGVLAVSGILINVIIAVVYGPETLGVFNQVYAIYIVASQFAVGGVHFSALKHVAQFKDDREERNKIVSSALAVALILGLAMAGLTYYARNMIGMILDSRQVTESLAFIAPALIFFSLNKVLISVLNGLRRMKAFSFAQAFRYLLLIIFIAAASLSGMAGYQLSAAYLFAESLLFLALLRIIRPSFSFTHFSGWDNWVKAHLVFGFKGFGSGILNEINTRVDVLMLGYFLNDRVVGLYTFAAMLAEGLYQLLVIIRNSVNPVLVKLVIEKNFSGIKSLVHKTNLIVYPAMTVIVLLIIGLFPTAIRVLNVNEVFMQSRPVLIILSAGILLCAGYIPYNFILIQAGFPGFHTILYLVGVGSNIALNALFIPWLGMEGAALATSCSLIIFMVYFLVTVKRKLNFSLI